MFSNKAHQIFNFFVDGIFAVILLFITIGLAIGTLQLFSTIWALVSFKGITGQYIGVITDVLTLLVLVELSRSLTEYFKSQRLRLTYILDAAIVFTIREVLILLFKHEIDYTLLYAVSFFLLVLGVMRTAAILVHQKERLIQKD